jgi:hypothetical protein
LEGVLPSFCPFQIDTIGWVYAQPFSKGGFLTMEKRFFWKVKNDERVVLLQVVFSAMIEMYGFVIAKINGKYKYIKTTCILESPTGMKVGTFTFDIDKRKGTLVSYVKQGSNVPHDFCLYIDGSKIETIPKPVD